MENILIKKLLQVIASRNSLDILLDSQVTYVQIATLLVECEKKGFITNTNEGYIITDLGNDILNKKQDFEVIETLDEFRIEKKIGIEQIYIPEYIEGVIKELKN